MKNEKQLRKQVFKIVTQIQKNNKKKEVFIPGKTYINYAGRIYNEKEVINLVDSSLDFWLTAGRYAQEFETRFAKYLNLKYAFLVNSGSSANLLAVSALTSPLLKEHQLKPGDEVITTACGFPTTLNPILQNGLVPVFVDVDLGTYAIDVTKIEKAITKKTKAIIVAHTLGNPNDLNSILFIAKKHKLWFIEDNCDALGSTYNGLKTGSFGHISTYSFYPAHHITMGEGGAVATNDALFRRILLSLRDWGRDCWCEPGHDNTCSHRFTQQFGKLPFGYDHKYVYSHIGYNLKATDMQAAIGCAQLDKLDSFIEARKYNFKELKKGLSQFDKHLLLPVPMKNSDPSWFGFPILVKENAQFKRADLVNYLEENKIATRMLFGGNLIKQPAYEQARYRIVDNLTNTNLVMNNLFWIGVYPGITKVKLLYIIKTFKEFFKMH